MANKTLFVWGFFLPRPFPFIFCCAFFFVTDIATHANVLNKIIIKINNIILCFSFHFYKHFYPQTHTQQLLYYDCKEQLTEAMNMKIATYPAYIVRFSSLL